MEEITVPEDFKDVTLSSSSFYKVPNLLDRIEYPDKLIRCIVLLTKSNYLLELQDDKMMRNERLEIKGPLKILVHHEFDPYKLYVGVLTKEKTMHLLDYDTLSEINVWKQVEEMLSEDRSKKGYPSLYLHKISGEVYTVTASDFTIRGCSNLALGGGKKDAALALSNKIRAAAVLAEAAKGEKIAKEKFIMKKMMSIKQQLTLDGYPEKLKSNSESQSSSGYNAIGDKIFGKPILRLVSIRQRVVHNKWVVCTTIVNESEKLLVKNPDLVLHAGPTIDSLNYKIVTLKIYRKSFKKTNNEDGSSRVVEDVLIEEFSPPILKPSKRAFLFAVCDLPNFCSGDSVWLDGLICFETRPYDTLHHDQTEKSLNCSDSVKNQTVQTQLDMPKQVPFPRVHLSASEMQSASIEISSIPKSSGVSLDIAALIAASVKRKLKIDSTSAPLSRFIKSINEDQRIIKVADLSNFYCFDTPNCLPLHHAAFSVKVISAHSMKLTIYTKDDNQGMILMFNLKKFLSIDAKLSEDDDKQPVSDQEVLDKMKFILDKVIDPFENLGEGPSKSSKTEEIKPNKVEMEREDFWKWRLELNDLCSELDDLYDRRTNA